MRKQQKKPLMKSLYEFLVKFEGIPEPTERIASKPTPKSAGSKRDDSSQWVEIYVPMFRNFKVFVDENGNELIIVIPTHISDIDDVKYHVIRESMSSTEHNGSYEILASGEFRKKYNCKFANVERAPTALKISDLASAIVDNIPEIKKLKRDTVENREESIEFVAKIITKFLQGQVGNQDL